MRNQRGQTSWVAIIAMAVVGGVLLGLPLLLHFSQKGHNELQFDVEKAFPPGEQVASGMVFAETLARIVEHELDSCTGWRPNDFVLWGPALWADNNSNRQLGILQAVRESTRVFKDHLTKVSSDQFHANLVRADTAFRNDLFKFWFPSAESKLREGVKALRTYQDGLRATPPRSRPINLRNVELIRLFQAWTDLLGDVHARLYRTDAGFFRTDDEFYYCQGIAHALYYLVLAVGHEYREAFAGRAVLVTLLGEVAQPLHRAATLKPLLVLDGAPDGLFANHRRNLDGYISEARQKMYSIREELEK